VRYRRDTGEMQAIYPKNTRQGRATRCAAPAPRACFLPFACAQRVCDVRRETCVCVYVHGHGRRLREACRVPLVGVRRGFVVARALLYTIHLYIALYTYTCYMRYTHS